MPFDFLCCVRQGVEDVQELDYSHQTLADVPTEVFVYERTLETLLCHSNHITELPRQLFMCHGLKYLDLSDNELQAIPVAISSLVNLQHLNLNRNTLTSIPDTMKALKYLLFLDLSLNPLEKLPDAITNLTALQELYLNDTYLEYLPGNFGRLANLRILELRDNYLMILPKSLSRSTELTRLDIGQNEIQQFPEVIARFLKLKELWLDCNNLTSIPPTVKLLESLVHLEASNNLIEELAPEIGFCSQLMDISLSSNTLAQLPDSIGQLTKLTTLKLDNNRLYSLPDTIGHLSNLEELMLMCNYLDKIPSSIGLLRKLQYLNIDDNLLRNIPPEIGSCTKLAVLSLRANKLKNIPPEVGHLSSLRVLNLVRNSLTYLPQSLLNCDNLVALWLSENQSKPLVPMHSEVDPQTYEQVLTCFLFPQVPLSPIESKLDNDKNVTNETQNSSRHISFVDMKVAPKIPEKPGQLRRAPTPYPKELRALAKHARNIHKDGTQDITPSVQNSVQIRAAKITPTLQQRFASDNKKDIEDINKDNVDGKDKENVKVSVYDNLPSENPYDRPLDLSYDQGKTYKSVDHALYTDNNDGNHNEYRISNTDSENYPGHNDIYASRKNVDRLSGSVINAYAATGDCQHNKDFYQANERNSLNNLHSHMQRLSITSQDRRSNTDSILAPHFPEPTYSHMPLIDNRPTYEHIVHNDQIMCRTTPEGTYNENIYDGDTYAHAKEKIYGRRSYDSYRYHLASNRNVHGPRIHTVSHSVSGSTTMPNLNSYTDNAYGAGNSDKRIFSGAMQKAPSPNANIYGIPSSSPTYVATQSPELYSPTGHTHLTNPYRMTHTPLVSDDGSYSHMHSPGAQNMYDLYDAIPASSNTPSVISHQHSPSSASEPIYGRGQPPPYHIAAPYTKHAHYFNGTGG